MFIYLSAYKGFYMYLYTYFTTLSIKHEIYLFSLEKENLKYSNEKLIINLRFVWGVADTYREPLGLLEP